MDKQPISKDLAYYLSLPYPILFIKDHDDDSWFVEIPLLRGCMSIGDDIQEAYTMIQEAKELWLEVALEGTFPIPEP